MSSFVRTPVAADPAAYLEASAYVDHEHAELLARARSLRGESALDTARRCFEFVRDQIAHSFDVRCGSTTCAASEVLLEGHGYCYAKSHLLTALLRANGLPAGLCYQRLTVDGPQPAYCLHGLVAVQLPEHGWYGLDARGNKLGVDARFEPPHERLAFPIQYPGERDFPGIYARPLEEVIACLRRHDSWDGVLRNLPDATEL